jgi:hypothetical protein
MKTSNWRISPLIFLTALLLSTMLFAGMTLFNSIKIPQFLAPSFVRPAETSTLASPPIETTSAEMPIQATAPLQLQTEEMAPESIVVEPTAVKLTAVEPTAVEPTVEGVSKIGSASKDVVIAPSLPLLEIEDLPLEELIHGPEIPSTEVVEDETTQAEEITLIDPQ